MNLSEYIKGNRKGKEANKIEKDSLTDPFLYDALDGYNSVQGDHMARINKIRRTINKKSNKQTFPYFKIVAILAILIFTLAGYLFINNHESNLYAQNNKSIIDIYVTQQIYEQNKETIEKQNHILAQAQQKSPQIEAFTVGKTPEVEISEEELELLSPNIYASTTPINIYMPAEDLLKDQQKKVYTQVNTKLEQEKITPNDAEVSQSEVLGKIAHTPISSLSAKTNTIPEKPKTDKELMLQYELSADEKTNDIISQENKRKILSSRVPTDTTPLIASNLKTESQFDKNKISQKETSLDFSQTATLNRSVALDQRSVEKAKQSHKSHPVDGYPSFNNYIKTNLKYPADQCANIQGNVHLEFSVDQTGTPTSITITKSLCPTCDLEAIRLITEGPKWTPSNSKTELIIKF